ncbi:MAG: hypothetical protein K8T10_08340 [Candidatus Eremiobacteraeota bacterium]|nr:hypothetical protein [Candidatus Eremiobacteraeota bacterium]
MEIKCTQCSAGITYKEGDKFVQCNFCEASLYIDRSRLLFHYWIKPTLDMPGAHLNLRRWMAGNETMGGLDVKAKTVEESFFFFPLWRFVIRRMGEDETLIEPAVSTPITEIRHLEIPAGMLNFYKPSRVENPEAFLPLEVSYESAMKWLEEREIDTRLVTQASIVHIPLYRFTYEYDEYLYSAVVEAATGKVLANVYPGKKEAPFLLVTAGTGLLLFVAGILSPNIMIRLIAMTALTVPLGFLANYVVKKY